MKKWFGPWSAARSRERRLSAGTLGFRGPNPEPSAFALLCTEQPTRRELMPRPRRARSIGVLAPQPRPLVLPKVRCQLVRQRERSGLRWGRRLVKDYAVPAAMIR